MNFEQILVITALLADILYPLLNWKLGLPAEFRWVSQFLCLMVILIGFLKILKLGEVKVIWLFLACCLLLSMIWALYNGQSLMATFWGVYNWLRYPLLGLYAFMTHPNILEKLKNNLPSRLSILAGLNLLIQLIQFATKEPIGDNLSGFWGKNGTNLMMSFLCLALAFQIGQVVVSGKFRGILFLLLVSFFSGLLGETKITLLIILIDALLVFLIYSFRSKKILKGFTMLGFFLISFFLFFRVYNLVISPDVSLLEYYLNPNVINSYLNFLLPGYHGTQSTYIGRIYQVTYTLKLIGQNPLTFLFGNGIGAQSTSEALGTAGIGLLSGSLGNYRGTSLTALVGDFGIFGICVTVFLIVRSVLNLLFSHHIEQKRNSVGIGLAIFIIQLPILMFYMSVWTAPITMLIFWLVLGQHHRILAGGQFPMLSHPNPALSLEFEKTNED